MPATPKPIKPRPPDYACACGCGKMIRPQYLGRGRYTTARFASNPCIAKYQAEKKKNGKRNSSEEALHREVIMHPCVQKYLYQHKPPDIIHEVIYGP